MSYLYKRYLREKMTLPLPRQEGNAEADDLLEKDKEYFHNLYPLRIRRMKDYVREEVNNGGSNRFWKDEYPDRVRLELARDRIFRKMQQDSVEEVLKYEEFSRDVTETLLYQEILEQRRQSY